MGWQMSGHFDILVAALPCVLNILCWFVHVAHFSIERVQLARFRVRVRVRRSR